MVRGLGPVVLAVALSIASPAASEGEGLTFPGELTDVDGKTFDVAQAARDDRVVVVTLKATWCPVCREQLARLQRRMAALRNCDARFVVLSPGPREALARIRDETGFVGTFVADDGLAIARGLGLAMAEAQIWPAMLTVNASLEVDWMAVGRNGARYGDDALLEALDCAVGEA